MYETSIVFDTVHSDKIVAGSLAIRML